MNNLQKVTIKSSKWEGRRYNDERVENLTKEGRKWIYRDGVKRGGALPWCCMEGDGLTKSSMKERVPNEFDISKAEHAVIILALEDAVQKKEKKIVIFKDSNSAARKIEGMEDEGEKAGPWEITVPLRNELYEFEIVWIGGRHGIYGNKIADGLARSSLEGGIDCGKREKGKGVEDGLGLEKELRRKEEKERHKKEGHQYYKRKQGKHDHWKGWERLDINVLIRLRTGIDSTGHWDNDKPHNRYHMLHCDRT
ncbi:hypothetical protein HOY82DRAFT_538649 [Tuber indicum]|nr:hypothetical protein HOY82DRAFT_538649 [Tuber indicum]